MTTFRNEGDTIDDPLQADGTPGEPNPEQMGLTMGQEQVLYTPPDIDSNYSGAVPNQQQPPSGSQSMN